MSGLIIAVGNSAEQHARRQDVPKVPYGSSLALRFLPRWCAFSGAGGSLFQLIVRSRAIK
jgi:hypothetical protein